MVVIPIFVWFLFEWNYITIASIIWVCSCITTNDIFWMVYKSWYAFSVALCLFFLLKSSEEDTIFPASVTSLFLVSLVFLCFPLFSLLFSILLVVNLLIVVCFYPEINPFFFMFYLYFQTCYFFLVIIDNNL